ncbi:MAG TPA: MFS transporter [Candidatus Saccharimonadia bacterium]|nr:MFS transporter [Candidatus Saccharimonadia bacterium]
MKSRALRWLYVYSFLDDFILIYPLYQLMFVAHGLSVAQISWLFVIWSAVSIVVEVPTGVLADRFSRKNLLAVGQVIRAAGYGMWLLVPNFWGYAAGFVLWGIGGALHSGTYEALVFDELKLVGQEKQYVRVNGRLASVFLVGQLIAVTLAAAAIGLGYNGVLVLSIATVLVTAVVAYNIPEAPRQEETADTGYFAELAEGVREAVKNPAVLRIIMLSGFIVAIFGSLEEYTPIFFQAAGASLQTVPLLEAALVLVTATASALAHRVEHLGTRLFMLLLAVAGVCLLASEGGHGAGGIVLVVAFFGLMKLLEVIFDGQLQHSIKGRMRATITSVAGFGAELLSIGIYLAFGAVAETRGTFAAFGVFGAVTVLVAVAYLVVGRRVFAVR